MTWSVCALSFVIDGAVLFQCLRDLYSSKPSDISFFEHLKSIKDRKTYFIIYFILFYFYFYFFYFLFYLST